MEPQLDEMTLIIQSRRMHEKVIVIGESCTEKFKSKEQIHTSPKTTLNCFSSRDGNKTRKNPINISSSNVSFFLSGVVLMEISEVHKKVQLELEETVSMQYGLRS